MKLWSVLGGVAAVRRIGKPQSESRRGFGAILAGALAMGTILAHPASAQTFTSLVNFAGTNGASPLFAPLIQGADGSLYGTTSAAGAHQQGTVFKVTTKGVLTTLYNFCAQPSCADGSAPFAGLALGKDGSFYGTTEAGGAHGDGTVFRITPRGVLTTLHSFNLSDGANPYAGVIQGRDGNLYGTTESGGKNILGTLFKISPQGVFTSLHSFNSTDGASPEAKLIQAADGNLYGTTYTGGANGYGTVFKMTPAGALTTLHVFADETEGRAITSGLVQASNGTFYGTTSLGGPNNYGCVYAMTAKGVVTILHSFNATDGATPNDLALGSDGNLYGTTISGGLSTDGTVFEVTPQGAFTTLHDFNGNDGADSFAGLLQASDGNFYGTTRVGGSKKDGVVFSINVGLGAR